MPDLANNIISSLRAGPLTAAELARRFRVDATTVGRRLKSLGAQVLKAGDGRATKWCLNRDLSELAPINALPIYRISPEGQAEKMATLHVVYPVNTYFVAYFRSDADGDSQSTEWRYYDSLPWWLSDMRPQGFLGRSFAQRLRDNDLAVDSDPGKWSEDLTLSIVAMFPQDQVGNLLIGAKAYTLWLEANGEQQLSDQAAGHRADAIARGEHFDSSAKGEQPKFIARLDEGECIVKFSGPNCSNQIDSVSNRWSDLLQSESLALDALNQVVPSMAATARCFQANNRTLLASKRFDRTQFGGRLGVISWTSLDLEFVGKANEPWPVIADELLAADIIIDAAATHAKVTWAFGQLIANSDMHLGNISCITSGSRPYKLAPIYDMLPMHYSPKSTGELPVEPYVIRVHASVPRVCWETAHTAAVTFWKNVLGSPQISEHFKTLAAKQLHQVEAFSETIRKVA